VGSCISTETNSMFGIQARSFRVRVKLASACVVWSLTEWSVVLPGVLTPRGCANLSEG
jgi:hypothetical protein